MKKTLAAVLAAAMALSTATVAMATDYEVDFSETAGSVDDIRGLPAVMGGSIKYLINSVTLDDADKTVIEGEAIATAMEKGQLTASVIVTGGQNKLSGRPSIKAGTARVDDEVEVVKYTWKNKTTGLTLSDLKTAWDAIENVDVSKMAANKEITVVCVDSNTPTTFADASDVANGTVKVYRKGDKDFETILRGLIPSEGNDWINQTRGTKSVGRPQLTVSFIHTYDTVKSTANMKLRFTVKKVNDDGVLPLGGKEYKKGDTITTEEVQFTAKYGPLSNYYEDMQLTKAEVADNNVILVGADLYDAIGDSKFTITFGDDIAMFAGKAAVNQKDVNLYYKTDEIDTIVDQYPTVDFTFLTFMASTVGKAPVFQNTGSMVFAAKDKNTTVYLYENDELIPVSDPKTYDDTYKTVTVKNVKKLGTYVIADQILEDFNEEPEEPAEPVDSTPVAEPDDDEGQNPNTGAC